MSLEVGLTRREFLKQGILLGAGATATGSTKVALGQTRHVPTEQDRLRNVVLSYLAQPKFSTPDFLEQLTRTKAELRVYNLDEDMLYFSVPAEQFNEQTTLANLTKRPDLVEFGKLQGDRLFLGDYRLRKPGHYFFRFPAKDFKVDQNKQIRVNFRSAQYTMTMDELLDFAENKSIYGGFLRAEAERYRSGPREITVKRIANHGAFVAKKGEPSLTRLVSQLTRGTSQKEAVAQRLLGLVTDEIKYDGTTSIDKIETLKRPNEVLMTRLDDCSGKVILYASLLEQTDLDYLLVYGHLDKLGHITVAVAGNFGNRNGLTFNLGGKSYAIAETTASGFRIGESRFVKPFGLTNIEQTQKPGLNSVIYDAKGKPLPFIR